MHLRSVVLCAATLVVLAGSSVHAQQKGGKGGEAKNGWLGSLSEGKAQAAKSGKPIMVVLRCVP